MCLPHSDRKEMEHVMTTFHDPNFEDTGRIHAYHTGVRVKPLRGNSSQARLSEVAIDRDQPRFCYNWLGLFICWVGHNCPVPSSPPHTPWSGAHWPNGMEQFTPFYWRQFITAVRRTACLFYSLFTAFLSNNSFSHSCGNPSATFTLFKVTESVKIWLSTMHTHNVLFCEQLNHISIVFRSYQYGTVIWHKLSTPCVTTLILSKCTNSSCEAAQTALSQTASNMVNLDPLLPTLCTGSSSLRGDEQHNFTVWTALSRTAPNCVKNFSPPGGCGGRLTE